ncbi:DUF6236 family protein [Pseudanabaena galeata UHCC 0370]|uniref:DUF6236 family protein n=1 Tax=Pseudanabaena galeata UHCC 0370 TaxID=3110310 RepID=A0ABU5TK94_9CYAN|nr:DUF6236 family protein [Pseudanabaena galeata]MEA5478620.1 DUF6236 family protein [Pseudanabaena galeata UHCC 0370]
MDKVLYFPYINVPNTAWFTRVLLYWDKVGSIVPSDHAYRPQQLDPHMRELVAAGLVEQVVPSKHIHAISNFSESFLAYVNANYKPSNKVKTSSSIVIHKEKMNHSGNRSIEIHIEKISQISDELVQLGLAELVDRSWYKVESKVANDYMAYLAATLGKLEDINAVPITDTSISLRLLSGTLSKNISQRRRRVREVILPKVLPSPLQPITLNDLIEFKESHGHLLQGFRRTIESICIDIANLEDPDIMEEQIQYRIDELDDAINEIRGTMRSRWHKITMGTLVPLLGTGVQLLATPLNPPLAFAGAAMSLAGAVYQAFDNEAQYKDSWNKPLAYAALAQSHLLQLQA